MSTLAEIEQTADALPLEEQKVLLTHLAARIGKATETDRVLSGSACGRSRRGFPISKGRIAFTSEDVARLEADPNGAA